MLRQARYYGYGPFLGEENPHHSTPDNKFNPMQQMAYLAIMVLLIPVQLGTGLLLWDIKAFSGWINMLGGVKIMDTIHVFFSSSSHRFCSCMYTWQRWAILPWHI